MTISGYNLGLKKPRNRAKDKHNAHKMVNKEKDIGGSRYWYHISRKKDI